MKLSPFRTLAICFFPVVVGRAVDLLMPDTGLQAGDVVHQLNQTPIDNMETLRGAINAENGRSRRAGRAR
jgi:membrane-associated protease RseP (regulator of RpoE activity)